MPHVQLSLLGGSSVYERSKRYRSARYDFGNGPGAPAEFFAAALLDHIKPDRLVILGTSGSMWDVLLETLLPGDAHDALLEELIDAASADATSQQQLDRLAAVLAAQLETEIRLRLIPYGRNSAEQIAILRHMADDIEPGSQVSLDVTHGLRHLPMLAQMSALYLRKARQVHIQGIYYGALDLTRNGITPVMDLKGLLSIADWVGALHTFDKDGDYGVFRDLLGTTLGPSAKALEEAAFFERIMRPGQARGKLRDFEKSLDRIAADDVASLFEPTLRERIDWCHENHLYQRQRSLARSYLAHGDYLRCAIFAFEAFITRLCQQQGRSNAENPDIRQKIKKEYEEGVRNAEYKQYILLRSLRNKHAHGDQAIRGDEQRALASPDNLRTALSDCLDSLLPAEPDT